MKRNKTIRVVTFLAIALFALGILSTNVQPASAYTFTRSSNVAMVPDGSASPGGSLYVGTTWPDSPGFTFTNLSPASIRDDATDPIVAGGYDTVVLMTADNSWTFASYWADSTFSSRILSFVNGGGKLIIYTSERLNNFTGFIYPFAVNYPGATGSLGGTLNNLANDTLSSTNPSDASYINLGLITAQTDAVQDTQVMTSNDPNWYIDMFAINANNVGGPAHTYAFYGAGLIIYNGLDIDYAGQSYPPSNAAGRNAIAMIWWRELCGQTLGPGASVTGLTLVPDTATNPVGTTHTVTAQVRNTTDNGPVPGVDVTFQIISGPNAGSPTIVATDVNGDATFSWSSSVDGTDTVQASILNAAGAPITATATKNWYIAPTNVIPEVPLGTAAITATMLIGLAAFYAKRRIKTPKL